MNFKSKLGLGTVQFGIPYGISNKDGQTSPQEVSIILKTASNHKIDTLDTASAYGNSEKILGENNLHGFKIVSKFMPPENEADLKHQLDYSLQNLHVKSLYGYLSHRPLSLCENPWQWGQLKEFKDNNLVDKIGFSVNSITELEDLLINGFVPDLIQTPFNYFDQRFEKQLIALKEAGCEIHARSALLQGLFFTDVKKLNSFFNEVKPIITSLQESVEYLAGSLLRFVIEKPFIDKVIFGVENHNQLLINLKSIEKSTELPNLPKVISEHILIPSNWPK